MDSWAKRNVYQNHKLDSMQHKWSWQSSISMKRTSFTETWSQKTSSSMKRGTLNWQILDCQKIISSMKAKPFQSVEHLNISLQRSSKKMVMENLLIGGVLNPSFMNLYMDFHLFTLKIEQSYLIRLRTRLHITVKTGVNIWGIFLKNCSKKTLTKEFSSFQK